MRRLSVVRVTTAIGGHSDSISNYTHLYREPVSPDPTQTGGFHGNLDFLNKLQLAMLSSVIMGFDRKVSSSKPDFKLSILGRLQVIFKSENTSSGQRRNQNKAKAGAEALNPPWGPAVSHDPYCK